MAIYIYPNKIQFTNYSLEIDNLGLVCNGTFSARSIESTSPIVGTVTGYSSSGYNTPVSSAVIDRFPFATDANATNVGNSTLASDGRTGQSSSQHGYTSGGFPNVNIIDRFPFASNANATDVGDLTVARAFSAGQSSTVFGYTSGGYVTPYTSPTSLQNVIDRFPFAVNANATDVGDLSQTRSYSVGQSSSISGYNTSGALGSSVTSNVIDKFPFASNANATDVGDSTQTNYSGAGQSSTVSGYKTSGDPLNNIIEKFPFATDNNASDVGDLTQSRVSRGGQSSTLSGYTSGGMSGVFPSVPINVIDKFPFSTDTNATDVGDLTQSRYVMAGQQD